MKPETRFAIIQSLFNEEIGSGLLSGAESFLAEAGVQRSEIDTYNASGAFEIPLLAKKLARTGRYAGIICLGAVIKGDTAHFEFISLGATMGIMQTMLETEVPVSFGILTTYTEAQAKSRSIQGDAHNKGREAAAAAWQTARTLSEIS